MKSRTRASAISFGRPQVFLEELSVDDLTKAFLQALSAPPDEPELLLSPASIGGVLRIFFHNGCLALQRIPRSDISMHLPPPDYLRYLSPSSVVSDNSVGCSLTILPVFAPLTLF